MLLSKRLSLYTCSPYEVQPILAKSLHDPYHVLDNRHCSDRLKHPMVSVRQTGCVVRFLYNTEFRYKSTLGIGLGRRKWRSKPLG